MTEHQQLEPTLPATDTMHHDATQRLTNWLTHALGTADYQIQPAFAGTPPATLANNIHTHYFRITIGRETRIVIDAQAAVNNYRTFGQVSALLQAAQLNAPTVLAEDLAYGYLLTTDVGAQTYLHALSENSAENSNESSAVALARDLLRDARDALVKWQLASKPDVLPTCDAVYLGRELHQFSDDYISRYLNATPTIAQQEALTSIFQIIADALLAQPRVYVHRGYVPKNLLVSEHNPGIIGFQGAMYGAISYDIASLYRDIDIECDEERALDGTIRYWEAAKKANLPVPTDFGDFYRDVEWTGLQRHLSLLGIFAHTVNNTNADPSIQPPAPPYFDKMPRLVRRIRRVGERYVALFPLIRLFDKLKINDGVTRTVGVSF